MSFESVRISYKVLCTRRWGIDVAEHDVEKYTAILFSFRPFLELNPISVLNPDQLSKLFQLFDKVFDPVENYYWSIVSFCIGYLELIVLSAESLAVFPTQRLETYISVLLEHNEARIRTSITDVIKALCIKAVEREDAVCTRLIPIFLSGIHRNWQRTTTTREAVLGTEKQILLDDTTGWNHLESYVRALHALFVGISRHSVTRAMKLMQEHYIALNTEDHCRMFPTNDSNTNAILLNITPSDLGNGLKDTILVDCAELLFTHASQHLNRHIRELSFRFIADLLALPTSTSTINVGAYDMPSRGVQITDVFPRMPGRELPFSSPAPPPLPVLPTHTPVPVTASTLSLPSVLAPEPMWHTNSNYHNAAHRIASALVTGLQDDWSQIRHAASMACQSFLMSLTTNTSDSWNSATGAGKDSAGDNNIGVESATRNSGQPSHSPLLSLYWPALLPRLCMNRFYPAVSVQTVSQATWRDILGPNALGRQLIAQHSTSVVEYYVHMTSARNHMTAEAACQAIAEFVQRMDASVVSVHIPVLLEALLDCLRDDRWPVRDAAIVASSMVTRYYATNTVTVAALPTLLQLWQENLTDFIWSIREHAAMAFAEAVQCNNSANTNNTNTSATVVSNSDALSVVSRQQSLVTQTALQYIRTHLLYALQSPAEVANIPLRSVSIADPTTTSTVSGATGPKPIKSQAAFSFLPQSLLEADAAAKRKKQQIDSATSNSIISSSATTPTATGAVTSVVDMVESIASAHSKNKDRKGWGCCIDCVELRTCLPWEVTHGAVYLLREMAMVDPIVLFEVYNVSSTDGTDPVTDVLIGENRSKLTGALYSDNTLLGKLISLLSKSTSTKSVFTDGAVPVSSISAGNGAPATPEADLLLVAVYEEVPIFMSTALQWVQQCLPNEEKVQLYFSLLPLETLFSSLTRDLKAAVAQDGTSATSEAPRYTTTTYGVDGSVSTSMTSGYRASSGASTASNTSSAALSSANTTMLGTASVSNSSAVNRRNQQVARRSARNRDKVLIAAERCLTRVFDLLCSAEVRAVLDIVYCVELDSCEDSSGETGVLSEEQLHDRLLSYFEEELRTYVNNLMKW